VSAAEICWSEGRPGVSLRSLDWNHLVRGRINDEA